MIECDERELWILGLGDKIERGSIVCEYLTYGGYHVRVAQTKELSDCTPLAILLDISPWSQDGWAVLLQLKSNPLTRDIPVLPLYLSQNGKVGEVFPVAGFFTLPVDEAYITKKLGNLGLIDESEDYDLQALLISRKGEERVDHAIAKLGFDVVNAYTGKEAVALSTIIHPYMMFCTLMLQDMSAFELLERLRLYPQTHNIPFFILLKEVMRDGERIAMSKEIDHLVRKNWLSRDEFLSFFKKTTT